MELLERFAQGEHEALEILFQQFQKDVYSWIVRIVRDSNAAEALTVETFWRIYKAHARYDPSRSFGAWARRIATNLAFDHLKKVKPEVEFTDEMFDPKSPDSDLQRDIAKHIRSAFGQLPPKLREAASFALIDEMPYEEIAELLDIPVGTAKSRVFRATRILRDKLQRLGIEP